MRRRGFTLIEILVVLSVMGVLFGLSIGFVASAGRGNQLLQTANSLVSQIATSRSQSQGNDSAYVKVDVTESGETRIRSFRNRQVFHWACEDFERASEVGVLNRSGNVDVATGGVSSGEGNHVAFAGGRVELANMADLAFRDGFSVKCRINPAADGSANAPLFQKGTNLRIDLKSAGAGRYDIEATIKLAPDRDGAGRGAYQLRTGFRGPKEVAEWQAPIVGGRWQDIQISYDRNTFSIYVNGRLRGMRTDRRNMMQPETQSKLVIGAGYMGGFDSLLIAGIFEDSDDTYTLPAIVVWVDENGAKKSGELDIHFRNRALDSQYHAKPIDLIFKLDNEEGARRRVQIALSGEASIKEAGE